MSTASEEKKVPAAGKIGEPKASALQDDKKEKEKTGPAKDNKPEAGEKKE